MLVALSVAGGLMVCSFLGLIPDVLPSAVVAICSAAAGTIAAVVSSRKIALSASAVTFSCASTLLLADFVLRFAASGALYYRPEEKLLNHWPPMRSLSRFVPHSVFAANSYGDLAAMSGRRDLREYRWIGFRSDGYGFPNPGISQAPADAILLGDSFGAGSGTDQAKTWATLLTERYGVNVYNLSIPDSSPWQELMNLKIEIGRIQRRDRAVVLWAIFSANDLDDVFDDRMEPELSESALARACVSAASFRNRSPIRRVCQRVFVALRSKSRPPIVRRLPSGRSILFRPGYAERVTRPREAIFAHPNHARLARVFEEMATFASHARLRVAVAVLPAKEEVYGWVLHGSRSSKPEPELSSISAAVRPLCETYGFRFMDLKPPMTAEAKRLLAESGALLWWSDDTHWNERGHSFAATRVFTDLLQPLIHAQ
jgi:hypothetical protein